MRTIDLFAGCGGMSLGFQNAGFEITAAYDSWGPAIEVYRRNFEHPIIQLDLATIDPQSFLSLKPELIIGGPPCQDFSSAGKRDEGLGRADLTVVFAQFVATVRPRYFVMENVDRIVKSDALRVAKNILREVGYAFTAQVLLASLCGVPQDRKRYFLVGELEGNDDALLPYFQKRMALQPMTVYDYVGNDFGIEYYYRHPRNYSRRAIFSIYEPSPTIRGVNRPVPKGYRGHPNDPCPITPALRPLTTLERSYIQTFPKTFEFVGTKSNTEQMIGNAVPVKLAEFVANCLQNYIRDIENGVWVPTPSAQQLELFALS